MSDIVYILAGSAHQAQSYAEEVGLAGPPGSRRWRYVAKPEGLRGLNLKPSQVVRAYGYHRRADVLEFENELRVVTRRQED